jgi:sec-independent protein translocase protein TatA
MILAMFGMPGGMEIILIILALVLFFGGKKIPELMKGLGGGIKEFKKASTLDEDETDTNKKQINSSKAE